jgi:hypothetical protein
MTKDAGNKYLDSKIAEAVQKNEHPAKGPVCDAHEGTRSGIHVLLLCEQDRRQEKEREVNSIKFGNITITGTMSIVIAAVVYLGLKIHGLL